MTTRWSYKTSSAVGALFGCVGALVVPHMPGRENAALETGAAFMVGQVGGAVLAGAAMFVVVAAIRNAVLRAR